MEYKIVVYCKYCNGSGIVKTRQRGRPPICRHCNGEGKFVFDMNEWGVIMDKNINIVEGEHGKKQKEKNTEKEVSNSNTGMNFAELRYNPRVAKLIHGA